MLLVDRLEVGKLLSKVDWIPASTSFLAFDGLPLGLEDFIVIGDVERGDCNIDNFWEKSKLTLVRSGSTKRNLV